MNQEMPTHIGEAIVTAMNRLREQGEQRSKEMEKPRSKKVYTIVKNNNGGKDFWLEIGRAFVNKDGSLNVKLNALPVNGSIHIRNSKAK